MEKPIPMTFIENLFWPAMVSNDKISKNFCVHSFLILKDFPKNQFSGKNILYDFIHQSTCQNNQIDMHEWIYIFLN